MAQPYQLVTIPTARKALKRLPKHLRAELVEKIDVLRHHPLAGEPLQPPLHFYRSFHTTLAGSQYRVLYFIAAENDEVVIVYAGTRENFYKEVRRLNLGRAS